MLKLYILSLFTFVLNDKIILRSYWYVGLVFLFHFHYLINLQRRHTGRPIKYQLLNNNKHNEPAIAGFTYLNCKISV